MSDLLIRSSMVSSILEPTRRSYNTTITLGHAALLLSCREADDRDYILRCTTRFDYDIMIPEFNVEDWGSDHARYYYNSLYLQGRWIWRRYNNNRKHIPFPTSQAMTEIGSVVKNPNIVVSFTRKDNYVW